MAEENIKDMQQTIEKWFDNGLIDNQRRDKLLEVLQAKDNSKNTLITFSIIGAISCGVLAFGTLVLDEKWIELLRKRFDFSEWIVAVVFSIITLLLIYWSKRRLQKQDQSSNVNEAFYVLIVMTTAIALAYIGRVFYHEDGNYAWLLLAATVVYGCMAIYLKSLVLWVTMLLSLIGWWGAQTYFWSKGANCFLGMNYPLRFTLFGIALLCVSLILKNIKRIQPFLKTTKTFLWFNLFVVCWALSIFGNSASVEVWTATRQTYFWYWALAYTLLTIAAAVYGFRTNNYLLRDLGLSFLLVNIYTRYFEYFWDKTNKGLFFAILAFSFWWTAKFLERWRRKEVV